VLEKRSNSTQQLFEKRPCATFVVVGPTGVFTTMIPQRPMGKLMHVEEGVGYIPNVDTLSSRPASDMPLAASTCTFRPTPHLYTKEGDLDMYEDAEEAADGQFEDAAGDSVMLIAINYTDRNAAETVPSTKILPPPPLPNEIANPLMGPPTKKFKAAVFSAPAKAAVTALRRTAPLPLNPFVTDEKKPKARTLNKPQDHPGEEASKRPVQITVDKKNSTFRALAHNLSGLNSAAQVLEAKDGLRKGYQLCCNDVVLRRGTRARRHPG
jgi:hypothetical protein